jgi:hypothetical protein
MLTRVVIGLVAACLLSVGWSLLMSFTLGPPMSAPLSFIGGVAIGVAAMMWSMDH